MVFVQEYRSPLRSWLPFDPHRRLSTIYVTPMPPFLEGGISLVVMSNSVFNRTPTLRAAKGSTPNVVYSTNLLHLPGFEDPD